MSSLWHGLRFRRDHRWTPRHVSDYLDLDLAIRARERLERHTAECPECGGLLDDLRLMLSLLHGAPSPELVGAGPAIATAVLRRLHEPAGD
jgi:anti-sigma factor RsiW